MIDGDLLVPAHAVLLHIGPHKTGTTAVQSALRQARDAMARHRVLLAGRDRLHMRQAAYAAVGGSGLLGDQPARASDWAEVTGQVRDATDSRVIVSSEFFSDATGNVPRRIVQDLGGQRVHLVVTLRPLAKVLPSSWQQYVRNRMRLPYEDWLTATLAGAPFQSPTATFWRRHQHDVLIEHWASLVGPENTTVIVMDEADRGMPLRVFEQLTGLPDGLLGHAAPTSNRSLTWAEAELVRRINVVAERDGWPARTYHAAVRQGAVRDLLAHPAEPGESPIVTPAWALQQAADIGAAGAIRIAALGVRVVGDLASLGTAPAAVADSGPSSAPTSISLDRAEEAFVGALRNSGLLDDAMARSTQRQHTDPARPREWAGGLTRRVRHLAGRPGRRWAADPDGLAGTDPYDDLSD